MEVRPGYKQTEMGIIPENWEPRPLLKAVRIASGQVDPKAEPYRSMILVAPDHIESGSGRLLKKETAADQRAISGKYLFAKGDIIYSKIRPYLKKAILANFEGLCSADMYPLKPASDVAGGFVFAAILGYHFSKYAESVSVRSGMPKINREELADYSMALPPTKAEQEAIAEALSDADALIESLEQLIAKKRHLKQGAMQELLTGRKRLPGFSGEWEVKPFDGVLARLNAKAHQIQTSDYQTTGRYPVVDQGKEHVIGFSDRHDKRFRCTEGGVIVFGDHTCIVKFINFDFLVGADGTQIIQAKSGQCTHFHALQLQHKGVVPTGYNRHFKFLKERDFLSPPLPEQTAIAAILSDMDAEIAALDTKLDKARQLKQGMMQELLTGRIRLV